MHHICQCSLCRLKIGVISATDEQPFQYDEDEQLFDNQLSGHEEDEPQAHGHSTLRIGCGELKLNESNSGKYQLYGESFNVACSYMCSQIRDAKEKNCTANCTAISVYCLLLKDECRKGSIAKMTIDLTEGVCTIEEEKTDRSTDESLQILVSLLQNHINYIF